MTHTLSLYLDALRFEAARAVFVSHYSAGRISEGLFWQFAGSSVYDFVLGALVALPIIGLANVQVPMPRAWFGRLVRGPPADPT